VASVRAPGWVPFASRINNNNDDDDDDDDDYAKMHLKVYVGALAYN